MCDGCDFFLVFRVIQEVSIKVLIVTIHNTKITSRTAAVDDHEKPRIALMVAPHSTDRFPLTKLALWRNNVITESVKRDNRIQKRKNKLRAEKSWDTTFAY